MKKIHNQSGFGAVEVLLTLIFVVLLVFVGWYIYHTDHKSTTPSIKTTTSSTAKAVNYFTITEWGVRAPYSGNLTLEYSPPTGTAPALVYLSSAQLDSSDTSSGSSCSNKQSGGAIQRYASTDEFLNPDGSPSTQTVAQYYSGTSPSVGNYVVVGNYYYIYSSPQAACSGLTTSQALQTQTISVFKTLVQNFKAVPSSN